MEPRSPASVAFIAPSVPACLGVTVAYAHFQRLPVVQTLFHGIAPAVMAIAVAAYKLGRLTNPAGQPGSGRLPRNHRYTRGHQFLGERCAMTTHPDGTLLKASGPEIDRMAGDVRRWVPDEATFGYLGLDWNKVVQVPDSEWSAIPEGPPYPSRADGTLLKASGPKIYVMQGGKRHWIPDPATFNASGYQWSAVVQVADADLNAIPEAVAVAASALASVNTALAQLNAALANFGSQPASAADMLALQNSMAQYTATVDAATTILADTAKTLQSVAQKIG